MTSPGSFDKTRRPKDFHVLRQLIRKDFSIEEGKEPLGQLLLVLVVLVKVLVRFVMQAETKFQEIFLKSEAELRDPS